MPLGYESHSCGTLDAVQARQISPCPKTPLCRLCMHASVCMV